MKVELAKIGDAFKAWETALGAKTIDPEQLVTGNLDVVNEIKEEGWEGLKEKYGVDPENMKKFFNFRRNNKLFV